MAHAERHDFTDAATALARVAGEVGRAFVGSPEAVEALLVALIARGHALVEGVPGVAKTTLCKSLAQTLGASFRRIQFTPDLLPADITGTFVFDVQRSQFQLRRGPIFAHVVLADEINRAPAKTQSALLEAMQEQQVTIEGETHPLEPPFIVLATQNPIEHEGTYALPEAQMDRFLLRIVLGYPSPADEREVLTRYARRPRPPEPVLSAQDVVRLQNLCEEVHVESDVHDYILALVHRTRAHHRVALGVSPRGALALLWAAKARALIRGRPHVIPDDVKSLAVSVLCHRLLLAAEAELDGFRAEQVITDILAETPILDRSWRDA